ncbi:hypothetical protein A3F65_00680 [Candidatus Saccharibacteria bacterium RIFCSPHIGHO2_12_FULL_47_16b]|nr:MAG: hypothetical protein A3F65_00680 [Candidatus Saccharibacteria bacterium RIFCSPHIGHO2_12_FULL_47_16b]OGL40176.1 MAG: hypothetical protein A3J32_01660 [Candidatus Saccharibacteria bacterium RIFCSPLOWO2_02_FULL_46_7]
MKSSTTKTVAIVVLGWNNQDLLADCFKSIQDQTYPNVKIIYVDNNSSDQSIEFVKKNFPEVEVLAQPENRGFAEGNNIGIRAALGDGKVQYVGLLNTDARLAADWTRKIVEFANLKPKGAFYQGTTLDYNNPQIIDSTHIYVSRNGQGTQGNWRHYFAKEIGPRKIFGTNAAACLISRTYIEAQPFSDFFDRTMFMYLEDVDAAARSVAMGWDNYLVPGARAYHIGSVSSGRNPGYSLYMTFRNNSGLLVKNFPFRILLRMWPKLVRGDLDTIRTLWRRGNKRAIWKVVKGRFVGLLRIPLFLPKRFKLAKYRQIDKSYLWDLMRRGY